MSNSSTRTTIHHPQQQNGHNMPNAEGDVKDVTPAAGIKFTVATRPQRRFSAIQTVSNLAGPNSFQPIPLPATGHVRKLALKFDAAATFASGGAIASGDAPFNLIASISLSDATGQPIFQPISGYNLYLVNKYLPAGVIDTNIPRAYTNPVMGPEYAHASTATNAASSFRLDLDFEQDASTGYGCIPNLDSNASLLLKIDVANYAVAYSGTGASAASVSVRVTQYYYAPISGTVGGVAAQTAPPGSGDFMETRYETQNVAASAESTVAITNRGGLIKGLIAVSRNAGVRTAFQPGANVGLVYDNNAIDEGVPLEEHLDMLRRTYGYMGFDVTTAYGPVTNGTSSGLDRGVIVWPFFALNSGRDSWLSTRVGSLVQLKVTPGAGATQLELVTQLMQVKDAAAFYGV